MATRARKTTKRKTAKAARKTQRKQVKRAAIVKGLSKKTGKKRSAIRAKAKKAGVIGDDMSQLNAGAVSTWTDRPKKR